MFKECWRRFKKFQEVEECWRCSVRSVLQEIWDYVWLCLSFEASKQCLAIGKSQFERQAPGHAQQFNPQSWIPCLLKYHRSIIKFACIIMCMFSRIAWTAGAHLVAFVVAIRWSCLKLRQHTMGQWVDYSVWQGEALFVRARSCLSCPSFIVTLAKVGCYNLEKNGLRSFLASWAWAILCCHAQPRTPNKAPYKKLRPENKSGKRSRYQGTTMNYE